MSAQKLQVFITMGLLMAVSGMLLVPLTPAAGTNTTTTTTTVATAMSFASYLIYANGNCDGDGTGETSFLGSCGQLFPGSTKVDCVDGSLNRMIYTLPTAQARQLPKSGSRARAPPLPAAHLLCP